MPKLAAAAVALAALSAAPSYAQAPAGPEVQVRVGTQLAAKTADYGERELAFLNTALARSLRARAGKGGWTRLDLVLEDAVPNRPTLAMQSRNVSLSQSSVSVGGAEVTGTAFGPRGPQPLRFSWWETDLRNEVGAGVWTDAERAFDILGGELGRGRVPDRLQGVRPTSRPSYGSKSAWRR